MPTGTTTLTAHSWTGPTKPHTTEIGCDWESREGRGFDFGNRVGASSRAFVTCELASSSFLAESVARPYFPRTPVRGARPKPMICPSRQSEWTNHLRPGFMTPRYDPQPQHHKKVQYRSKHAVVRCPSIP